MEFHKLFEVFRTKRGGKQVSATCQKHSQVVLEPIFPSDSDLVNQALAGSEQAFEMLVARYNAPLFRFISSFVGDYDQACDIFQQVMIQLYASLPTIHLGKSLRPWLFQVARYRCIDELRRGHVLRFSDLENENEDESCQAHYAIPDPTPPPEELAEQHEVQDHLCRAIRALPLHYRTIVALRYALRLSFVEIGETLGIPETTARTYFQRAKPLMRESLKGMHPLSSYQKRPA
jgi:RNA polymerase sigma-70 factor (ECF subfamily)